MPKDFLLEIGMEEAPHEILPDIINQTKELAKNFFENNKLEYEKINVWATPRRLVIYIKNLSEKQQDIEIFKKGPALKYAYDINGNPTKALLGFLKSLNISVDQTSIEKIEGTEYVVYRVKEKGKPTTEILKSFPEYMIKGLKFEKSMFWSNYSINFIRPIRWIVCLFGKELIETNVEHIKSQNFSYGHRLLWPSEVNIPSAEEYKEILKKHFVIVDQEERQEIIYNSLKELSEKYDFIADEDKKLIQTNVFLTEYPVLAVGEFSKHYLELPPEVLISEMKDHQKIFPVRDKGMRLINKFIVVLNTKPNEEIVKGYERVLKARFSDGWFLYKEDSKKKLEEFLEKLKGIEYISGLGSLYDKSIRMVELVELLSTYLNIDEYTRDIAKRAAYLSKADLATSMVYEFPELEGIMGYYYALASGEPEKVALAIREHYLPKTSDDQIPSTMEGALVSIADKLDALILLFSSGRKVTGSKDPYSLRRQTIGIIKILIEKQLFLDMKKILEEAIEKIYRSYLKESKEVIVNQIIEFIKSRLKNYLRDENIALTDEIDAILSMEGLNVYDAFLRIKAIHDIRKKDWFIEFVELYKRIRNIIQDQKFEYKVEHNLFKQEEERLLYTQIRNNENYLKDLIKKKEYTKFLEKLKDFKDVIHLFFDKVLVMEEDIKLRYNRLSLLKMLYDMFLVFGDFNKLEFATK